MWGQVRLKKSRERGREEKRKRESGKESKGEAMGERGRATVEKTVGNQAS